MLLGATAALAIAGAGRYSLDHLIASRRRSAGVSHQAERSRRAA